MSFRAALRRTLIAATLLLGLTPAGAWAEDSEQQPDFRQIAKFALSYDDQELGLVEGMARCDWSANACHISIRNPASGELREASVPVELEADPQGVATALHFSLPMSALPSGAAEQPPAAAGQGLSAEAGETASIIISNNGVEQRSTALVAAAAPPDGAVSFDFTLTGSGALTGQWSYRADPLTRRGPGGAGPSGIFRFLSDADIAATGGATGGFLGIETGGANWQPLLPRLGGLMIVEDQADLRLGDVRYPRNPGAGLPAERFDPATGARPESEIRTLVLIGSDLPIDGKKVLLPISSGNSAISYEVVAVGNGTRKALADAATSQIERAFREAVAALQPADEAAYRRQDAVVVRATLSPKPDAGPQSFSWGTYQGSWMLQYGDNFADVHFARFVRDGAPFEPVSYLTLPEKVVVEVRTPDLDADTLPLFLGLPGSSGPGIPLVASRVPGQPRLYRTPPMIFADANGPAVPADGATVYRITASDHVYAALDKAKTNFLRETIAQAGSGPPWPLWNVALSNVRACIEADYAKRGEEAPPLGSLGDFARLPVEEVSLRGTSLSSAFSKDSFSIRAGDHAAMLLLRDSFAVALQQQLDELASIANNDDLVDAWYRIMQAVVIGAPTSPIATFAAASPLGTVSFHDAYSVDFEERAFHVHDGVTGHDRYIEWRRQTTRAVLLFMRGEMQNALARVKAIGACDRAELLKLTGHGFANVASRLAPMLMKYRSGSVADGSLAEPDFIARSYVQHLDEVATAVAASQDFTSQADSFMVQLALTLAPGVGEYAWVGLGVTQEAAHAAAFLGTSAFGVAAYAYETKHLIAGTLESNAEYRFAYSTASLLGVDRYFTAEAQKRSWWGVGATIVGQGVMLGVGTAIGLKVLNAPTRQWAGARAIASADAPIRLPTLRQMPVDAERPVILSLLKEQELLERAAALDARGLTALEEFNGLAGETAGVPRPPEPDAAVAALERQAADPIDPMEAGVSAPADPLREAKAEIADAGLMQAFDEQNAAGLVEDPVPPEGGPPPAEQPPAAEAPVAEGPAGVGVGPGPIDAVAQPVELPPGVPPPYSRWTQELTVGGKSIPVTFDIGKVISKDSAFFVVYELKQIPPELAGVIPEELGKDLVLKVLKRQSPLLMRHAAGPNKGIIDHVVARMLRGEEILTELKVEHLPIMGWDEADIVLQKRLTSDYEVLGLTGKGSVERQAQAVARAEFLRANPQYGKAIAKLWGELAGNDIAWLDGHLGNIYFRHTGEGLVAGILDQDMLGTMPELLANRYFARRMRNFMKSGLYERKIVSMFMPGDRAFSDANSVMQKLLEHYGFLRFSTRRLQLADGTMLLSDAEALIPGLRYTRPSASAVEAAEVEARLSGARNFGLPKIGGDGTQVAPAPPVVENAPIRVPEGEPAPAGPQGNDSTVPLGGEPAAPPLAAPPAGPPIVENAPIRIPEEAAPAGPRGDDSTLGAVGGPAGARPAQAPAGGQPAIGGGSIDAGPSAGSAATGIAPVTGPAPLGPAQSTPIEPPHTGSMRTDPGPSPSIDPPSIGSAETLDPFRPIVTPIQPPPAPPLQ